MPAQTPIKLEGALELELALSELPKRVQNRVVKQALRSALRPVHRASVAATPVGREARAEWAIRARKALRRPTLSWQHAAGKRSIRQHLKVYKRGWMRRRGKSFVEHRFGTLKRNVKLRAMRRSRVRQGMIVTSGDRTGRLNTGEAYYGAFVHWGHGIGKSLRIRALQQRAVRARKRGGSSLAIEAQIAREDTRARTRAQPWLADTFNRMKDETLARLISVMRFGIFREATELGRSAAHVLRRGA